MSLSKKIRKIAESTFGSKIFKLYDLTDEYLSIYLLLITHNNFFTNQAFKYEIAKYTQMWRHDVQIIKGMFENSDYKVNKVDYNGQLISKEEETGIRFSLTFLSKSKLGENKNIHEEILKQLGYEKIGEPQNGL